ncbi:MAG TPA: Gfo/Idh/MocA family oxidoreductase [Dehalococcoidia bacterium]|nr:Gfo/Idh/MocA family oxidoreductase [Dehalococcoidia bacterium]
MADGWAIVGTGRFAANRIAPALNKALGSRLVAVVSRERERAEAFAQEHGARKAYDDLDAAMRDPDVAYVWVATPHSLHLDPVLAAARAGKHVLCEKPLATSRGAAREMLRACRRAGVQLGTGFQLRHHPLMEEARRLVQAGETGPIRAAEAEWSNPPRRPGEGYSSPWRSDPELAFAGISTGTGIHAIDLLRFVLEDEITAITALTDGASSPIAPLETAAIALLRFSRGTLATVRCLRGVPHPQNDLLLLGEKARLAVRHSLDESTHGELEADDLSPEISGVPAGTDMYARQAGAFVNAVRAGAEPSASGEDGLRAVEALDALLEAARTGRTVSLE